MGSEAVSGLPDEVPGYGHEELLDGGLRSSFFVVVKTSVNMFLTLAYSRNLNLILVR